LLFSSVLILLLTIQRPVAARPDNLAPGGGGCECRKKDADEIMFKISMKEFQRRRKAESAPCCNWESVRPVPSVQTHQHIN
jgi:hypothetical protein